ncbi:MAG: hypothetical protein IKF17_03610 [Clostridia bacterium]|nr:hypothetical protein [Clostridia bacterium]
MVKKVLMIIYIVILTLLFIGITNVSFAYNPKGTTGSSVTTGEGGSSADDIISGANGFIESGENKIDGSINEGELVETSNSIYNMLLAIAMVAAVAVGVYLGIKFMVSSVEEQAKVKELLVPYVAGCIVIFGAMGIWKLAVTTFSKF